MKNLNIIAPLRWGKGCGSLVYLERCRGCDAEDPARCEVCSVERAPMLITQFHCKGTGEHPAVVIAAAAGEIRG